LYRLAILLSTDLVKKYENGEGRLVYPCYFAVENSLDMGERRIEVIRRWINEVVRDPGISLLKQPLFSVITFSDTASVLSELNVPSNSFDLPKIDCQGSAKFSPLFRLLHETLNRDVESLSSENQLALYRLCFLFSLGNVADAEEYFSDFDRLRNRSQCHTPVIISVNMSDADSELLSHVATRSNQLLSYRVDESSWHLPVLKELVYFTINLFSGDALPVTAWKPLAPPTSIDP